MSAKIYELPLNAITARLQNDMRHFLGVDRMWHARKVEQEHKNVVAMRDYQDRRIALVARSINPEPTEAA